MMLTNTTGRTGIVTLFSIFAMIDSLQAESTDQKLFDFSSVQAAPE